MIYSGLFSWIYSFVTALSVIMIGQVTRQFNPILSLLFSVLLSTVYFHILNWNTIPTIYCQLNNYKRLGLAMCLIVAIVWFCTFYSISLTGPFSFIMVYFTIPAILSNILLLYQNRQNYRHKLSILILSISIICYITLHANYATNFIQDIKGMFLAALGGLTGFAYLKLSYRFQQKTQLTATQILAIRSYVIIVLFPLLVPSSAYKQFFQTSIRGWLLLAFLTFLTFIIPVYCNQKGIQQVGVEKHAIIIASCPIFAYILSQIFIKDQLLPFPKLLLILAISTSAGLALSLLPGKRPISK